jgi:hypothetical protein
MDELVEHFTLLPNEMALIGSNSGGEFSQALFPAHKNEVPTAIVKYIAKQKN